MLRNALGLVSGNFVQAAVAFAANLVLVRYIDPGGFGRYALAAASIGLAFSVFSLRVGLLIVREPLGSMTASRRAFFINAIVVDAVIASVVCVCVASITDHLDWKVAMLIGVGVCVNLSGELKSFLERDMAFIKLIRMETLIHLGGHILSVVLVVCGAGALALYIRDLALAIFGLVGVLFVTRIRLTPPRWPRWQEWRQLLAQAGPGWFDQVLEQLFARAVVLTAGAVGGERAAGVFSQAQRLAGVPHQFLAPLAFRLSFTAFSRQTQFQDRVKLRNRMLLLLGIPLAGAAFGTIFLSEPVVPLLLGPQWADVAVTLTYMSGAVVCITLFENLKAYVYAGGYWYLLVVARAGQVAGLMLPILLGAASFRAETAVLGLGLSCAYVAGFLILFIGLIWTERGRS